MARAYMEQEEIFFFLLKCYLSSSRHILIPWIGFLSPTKPILVGWSHRVWWPMCIILTLHFCWAVGWWITLIALQQQLQHLLRWDVFVVMLSVDLTYLCGFRFCSWCKVTPWLVHQQPQTSCPQRIPNNSQWESAPAVLPAHSNQQDTTTNVQYSTGNSILGGMWCRL